MSLFKTSLWESKGAILKYGWNNMEGFFYQMYDNNGHKKLERTQIGGLKIGELVNVMRLNNARESHVTQAINSEPFMELGSL